MSPFSKFECKANSMSAIKKMRSTIQELSPVLLESFPKATHSRPHRRCKDHVTKEARLGPRCSGNKIKPTPRLMIAYEYAWTRRSAGPPNGRGVGK
mmetsp:Transcript_13467/g.16064  ORF Transcript_13467/g.16064 Transcript_13467/m.16064 type:complete len:96 (-) Transcript_13467:217-504(-)